MAEGSKRIAIFDVCDTLFSTNTTLGFLTFFARSSGNARAAGIVRRWSSRGSPGFYLGALAHRLLGWDLARARLIRSLAGHSRKEVEAAAVDYVRLELPRLAVEPVQELLRKQRASGDRVILASSSLDVVVAAIARELQVEWVASQLGFANGCCTGRLARDLTGRKPAALRPMIAEDASVHVYTDNRSDKALLQMADHCTIILPAGSSGQRWAGEDCDYLAL